VFLIEDGPVEIAEKVHLIVVKRSLFNFIHLFLKRSHNLRVLIEFIWMNI